MSALDNIRQASARLLRRPAAYLAAEMERWSPRTRRLVGALGAAIGVMIVVLAAYLVFDQISELEDGNGKIREALAAIDKHRDEYLEAKARNAVQEARIGDAPPQLTGDLEAAARGENIQIAESSERPAAPAGRRYVEHDVDLRIREVDLPSLSKFMRRVETGPRLVYFSRLSLKHRYSTDSDKLDAELTATAFEKVKEDKTKKKPEKTGGPGATP
jgi:type II secretory pathway component PulM